MTNQEAKKKVCPISRLDCLGDRCAVWEWTKTSSHIQVIEEDLNVRWRYVEKNQWQGRCGFVK